MVDQQADRLSIPSSSTSEAEERRYRQYDEEARNQDLSPADDKARDRVVRSRMPGPDVHPERGSDAARE